MVLLDNCFYIHDRDQWDSFRNEGRIPLNMGFGLSLLGYEVNIAYHGWNAEPKTTWNGIVLSKNFLRDYYDVALSFSTFNAESGLKFDKGISIIYEQAHINRAFEYERASAGKHLQLVTTYRDLVEPMSAQLKRDVRYLPPLYPIPCYSTGFLPPSFNPDMPTLKVYLHYTSWPQNTTMSGDRFRTKEQAVIDHLKNRYRVKLSILVAHRNEQCPIQNEDITYYYSSECNYKNILDLIRSSDICITSGSSVFPGSGMTDIVTLGGPLIYIGDGRLGVETKQNVSLLYKGAPENIIYLQESNKDSMEKVDRIMSDPAALAKKYQDFHSDHDFNNWKKIVAEQGLF